AIFIHLVVSVNAYHRTYLPAVAFLDSILKPDDLVTGTAELAFHMGFYNPQLVDDLWLGRWSGKRPTIVVVDDWYYRHCMEDEDQRGIGYLRWVTDELKRDFIFVKTLDGYSIYRRVKQ